MNWKGKNSNEPGNTGHIPDGKPSRRNDEEGNVIVLLLSRPLQSLYSETSSFKTYFLRTTSHISGLSYLSQVRNLMPEFSRADLSPIPAKGLHNSPLRGHPPGPGK